MNSLDNEKRAEALTALLACRELLNTTITRLLTGQVTYVNSELEEETHGTD